MIFLHLLLRVSFSPVLLIADVCRVIFWLLVSFTNWVHWDRLEPLTEQTIEQLLDLRCIIWTLQILVDGLIRRSALEYLATMALDDFNPIQFVAGWFELLVTCMQVTDDNVAIIQGFEWLANRSSLFCLHMLSHLVVADQIPRVLDDVRRRYTGIFPFKTN